MRWIHVSDLHFGHGDGVTSMERDVACNALLEDAERMRKQHGSADFLFVTGDVAWSGKAKQYVKADEFLTKLCMVSGVPPGGVFVVPGNHDVDRDAVVGASQKLHAELRGARKAGALDRALADETSRTLLIKKLDAYRVFATRWCPAAAGAGPHYVHALKLDTGNVEIHGLCSALLTSEKDDVPRELELGLTQRTRLHHVPDAEDPVLHVVLMHHPTRWLSDGPELQGILGQRAHLQFTGHVHVPSGGAVRALFGPDSLSIEAGAVHSREDAASYTYSWGQLTPTGGLRYWPRALINGHMQRYQPDIVAGELDRSQSKVIKRARLMPVLQQWLSAAKARRPREPAPSTPSDSHAPRLLQRVTVSERRGPSVLGVRTPTGACVAPVSWLGDTPLRRVELTIDGVRVPMRHTCLPVFDVLVCGGPDDLPGSLSPPDRAESWRPASPRPGPVTVESNRDCAQATLKLENERWYLAEGPKAQLGSLVSWR